MPTSRLEGGGLNKCEGFALIGYFKGTSADLPWPNLRLQYHCDSEMVQVLAMEIRESRMPKAILKNGQIQPLDPLPADWTEGQELDVEASQTRLGAEPTPAEIDSDFQKLDAICALGDSADDERLERVLDEAHRQAKEQVRRKMGFSVVPARI